MGIRLGIIGGGVMGEAILSRLLSRSLFQPAEVLVSDPQVDRLSFLKQTYGVGVSMDNPLAWAAEDCCLLAIKPQILDRVAANLAQYPTAGCLISILAGVEIAKLESLFPQVGVIRAMPNTPATVGAGMTAIAAGSRVNPDQLQLAQLIFKAVGEVVELPENLLDAVTGLSGSGPAYVAIMVEALADGGVAAGLPRAIAQQLALQTVWGTAELLRQSEIHPAILKDRVASPGGTTIAGIGTLEALGFRSALIESVKSAYLRSVELGRD
jgi:pyrroline-5-carboxylate reductase